MNDTNNFEKTILPIIFVNRAHWLGKIIYIYIHVFFVVFLILSRFVLSRLRIISNYTTVTLIYTSSISVTREKRDEYIFSIIFANYTARQSLLEGIIFSPSCLSFHFASIIISLPATLINSTSVSTTSIEIKIIHIFFFFLTFSIKRRKEFWFNSQNQQLFPTREHSMIVSIFWRI